MTITLQDFVAWQRQWQLSSMTAGRSREKAATGLVFRYSSIFPGTLLDADDILEGRRLLDWFYIHLVQLFDLRFFDEFNYFGKFFNFVGQLDRSFLNYSDWMRRLLQEKFSCWNIILDQSNFGHNHFVLGLLDRCSFHFLGRSADWKWCRFLHLFFEYRCRCLATVTATNQRRPLKATCSRAVASSQLLVQCGMNITQNGSFATGIKEIETSQWRVHFAWWLGRKRLWIGRIEHRHLAT